MELKLSKQVLRDTIKDFIVKLILDEEVKPGGRIVESVLARKLGVSQGPVREAIRDLVLIGILRSETYHGTFVSDFSTEQMRQAYQVKSSIEATGIKLAVPYMTDSDIEKLEKIYLKMINANTMKNTNRVVELDNMLHEEIMRLSRNEILYNLWKTLRYDIWSKFTFKRIQDNTFLASRHDTLIKALKTRDPEKAEDAMRHHILDLEEYL